jgi:hypothetical protein
MNGYIIIDKRILDWTWYKSTNERTIFIHLLITANYENKTWRGIKVNRGQLITSYKSLSNQTGLSLTSCRTSLMNLKLTGEITSQSTNRFTIITICKYDDYQNKYGSTNKPTNKPNGKQTDKPISKPINNNIKKRKETEKTEPAKLFKFLPVSWIEFENAVKYHSRNENSNELAFEIAYKFDDMNWTTSTGKKIDKNNYDSMVHNYIKKPELL